MTELEAKYTIDAIFDALADLAWGIVEGDVDTVRHAHGVLSRGL